MPTELAQWEELDLREAPLFELSLIKHFTGLHSLDLSDVPAMNFDPVAGLAQLKSFEALGCRLGDLSFLSALSQLERIDISYPLENPWNWDVLSALTNLEEVYVNHCGLHSLAAFDKLPKLKVLCVHFNKIPLAELTRFSNEHPDCQLLA